MWVDNICFPEATAGVRIFWISHSVRTCVCIFFDCVNDLNRPLFPFSSSLSFLPQSKSQVNTIEFYPQRLIFSKCCNASLCIICSSLSFYTDISLKLPTCAHTLESLPQLQQRYTTGRNDDLQQRMWHQLDINYVAGTEQWVQFGPNPSTSHLLACQGG